ncbi:MAG: ribosome silencing factor [Alphaproteobacteria bacterium]|nr:MAG: ribosome silencing factor [Alphaproteobacteria bacterium]
MPSRPTASPSPSRSAKCGFWTRSREPIEKSGARCYLWPVPAPGKDRRVSKEDHVLSESAGAAGVAAAAGARMNGMPAPVTSDTLLERIIASLEEDKAEDIVSIPLRGKSTMADFMVICSGRSSRQVASIADHLTDRLKQQSGVLSKVEGKEQGDWVLIDAGDVVVHVFRPEVRDFYQLERLWMPPAPGAPAEA